MCQITHMPQQGPPRELKDEQLKVWLCKMIKDIFFLPLLLKLAIVALGHRLDLYNRLEIAFFHPKLWKDILWPFSFILIYNFFQYSENRSKALPRLYNQGLKKGSYDT